jgi:hypothetical protein
MAGIRDNFPEVKAALSAIGESWDFRKRGLRKTFGQDAVEIVAKGIYERTFVDQLEPDGSPLAPLKPSTIEKKQRLGYPETIGVETGEMGKLTELEGEPVITRRAIRMTYGLDSDTQSKAEWFTEGDHPVQEPRPFYELDEVIEGELDQLFEGVLERNIHDAGGREV